MDERVQVLVLDSAQVNELGAPVTAKRRVDDVRSAVDHDLVAAIAQPRGDLFGVVSKTQR